MISCFIVQQISILEWFLKDHMVLNSGVMGAENTTLITAISYILKYIKTESIYFK